MTGTDDTAEYPGHGSGELDPGLKSFVGSFSTEEGQNWAAEAAQRVQQHLTMREVANQNIAAGEQFVHNMDAFKGNLVGMVQSDPSAAGLALDLIPHTVNAMAAEHGGMDENTRSDAASQLISHMSGEVAQATIHTLAQSNAEAARQALASPRLAGHLPDADRASLAAFIDTQERLRVQDAAASQQQANHVAALNGYHRGTAYLDKLIDPDTGGLQLPNDFGQTVMRDTAVPNETSAALHFAYSNLQANGDPGKSDPAMVADFFKRAADGNLPSQAELIGHVGGGISLADAKMLNGILGPQSQAAHQDISMISDTVQNMRSSLLTQENGPSGGKAFGRFMDWFMPALRTGAGAGVAVKAMLDPEHQDTILGQLPQFQPGPRDVTPASAGPRPPLGMIFAEAQKPTEQLNDALKPVNALHEENMRAPGGDNFFQRLLEKQQEQQG